MIQTWSAFSIPLAWVLTPAICLAAAAQDARPPAVGFRAAQTFQDRPVGNHPDSQSEGTPENERKPERAVDLSSPRATMATFLNAIDEAERGQVERYPDVLACLDLAGLSDLPEDARVPQGRKLATLLKEFIDEHGVELELVPDRPDGEAYVYHRDADGRPEIQIARRGDTDDWVFTWASLEFLQNAAQEPPAENGAPKAEEPLSADRAKQEPAQAETGETVPVAFRSAQATMRTFLDAMKAGRIEEAAECLDLSDVALVARGEKGKEAAHFLHAAIQRTKVVVLPVIPDDPKGKPYIFRQDELGSIVIARQGDGDERAGHWLFTKDTVAGVETLYDALEKHVKDETEAWRGSGRQMAGEAEAADTLLPFSLRLRSRIPEWLKGTWFLLRHWQWLGLLILLLSGAIAQKLATALLRRLARLWLRHKRVAVDQTVQLSSFRPVGILAMSGVWYWGIQWLSLRPDVLTVLMYAVKFIACVATVWTVYRAVDLLSDYFTSLAEKTETTIDDLVVPFARKTAKIGVTVLGALFIIQQFTSKPPYQLLAGLGLGGLALALAAQDTLKNLFGSLTVIIDRPFKVGDWVLIGDVEGTVESVGFRSTRIRTFYNSQIVVPNSSLMSATIDNYGARRYRRAKIMLSITYTTPPEKIDAFCEGIRELIRLHPYTRKDYYHVYFNKFAASSLDILLYTFFEVPDWSTELRERHRLFIDILRLARRLCVEFAFPTQTVWLERSRHAAEPMETASITPGKDDPDAVGFHEAAKAFEEAYGQVPAPRAPVVIDTAPRSKQARQTEPPGGDGRRS